jgi:hypothetical protein
LHLLARQFRLEYFGGIAHGKVSALVHFVRPVLAGRTPGACLVSGRLAASPALPGPGHSSWRRIGIGLGFDNTARPPSAKTIDAGVESFESGLSIPNFHTVSVCLFRFLF